MTWPLALTLTLTRRELLRHPSAARPTGARDGVVPRALPLPLPLPPNSSPTAYPQPYHEPLTLPRCTRWSRTTSPSRSSPTRLGLGLGLGVASHDSLPSGRFSAVRQAYSHSNFTPNPNLTLVQAVLRVLYSYLLGKPRKELTKQAAQYVVCTELVVQP